MTPVSGICKQKIDDDLLEYQKSSNHNFSGKFCSEMVKITLSFMVIAFVCLVLNQSTYPNQLLQKSISFSVPKDFSITGKWFMPSDDDDLLQQNISSSSNETSMVKPTTFPQLVIQNPTPHANNWNIELEIVLSNASMGDNKTVIITTLNAAWAESDSIFDLFLESFRIGNGTQWLMNHLIVVSLDKKAHARCLEVHHHCYALLTDGIDFSGEAHFMGKDYLKMMWRRIDFLRSVLQLGYDFVFTDADVMWFRNPFQRFYPDGDFQIACDHYVNSSTSLKNSPNGGFNYVKASNRTIQFYKYWHAGKDYFPGKHDQDVLNMIKYKPFLREIGLKIRFLDTTYFGGFCEPSKDLNVVVTMHANCCIGMKSKIHDIKMLIDDWKKYVVMPVPNGIEGNSSHAWTWTLPRICGW